MSEEIRVRFAPSPTGHLHVGGARTALFNWLFARNLGGKFILRIEDTDRSRSTDEYIASIIEGMKWLGLDWDEGPYRQTDRFDAYRKHAEEFLKVGKAYRCYCTAEELDARREEAIAAGHTPSYDRRCRKLTEPIEGKPFSIRFKTPTEGETIVSDIIRGHVTFENSQLDDLIIVRSDGTPTYNFCVVVDDYEMRITHVVRGDDHLNNTPRQVHIYRALGYDVPRFAHLPMILGADKTRLSKRHGATSVLAYRDTGHIPEALVNYLVRLGWSHGDQEVFTPAELIKFFSLEHIGKSASVFNPEKLLWLNAEYMKLLPPARIYELIRPFLIEQGTITPETTFDPVWMARAIGTLTERSKTLLDLAGAMRYYITDTVEIDPKAKEKHLTATSAGYLKEVLAAIEPLEFNAHALEPAVHGLAEKLAVKLGAIAQPVRVALTGGTQSAGIFEVLEIVGRERAINRIKSAIEQAGA